MWAAAINPYTVSIPESYESILKYLSHKQSHTIQWESPPISGRVLSSLSVVSMQNAFSFYHYQWERIILQSTRFKFWKWVQEKYFTGPFRSKHKLYTWITNSFGSRYTSKYGLFLALQAQKCDYNDRKLMLEVASECVRAYVVVTAH